MHGPGSVLLGGSPAFMRGKERFSAPGDVRLRSCALAPGWRNPGANAQLKNGTFFPWTEVQFPLLKQGTATKSLHEFFTTSEGRIYRQLSQCTAEPMLHPDTPTQNLL